MTKHLIGIIVPVYKTEKYVAECIESILAQTYTEFRLILVDDGSPDDAGKICDEYAKKDNRITVIHQENAGVTRARARGVEVANDCEWITFVDSDDTIIPHALEKLFAYTSKDTNIVFSDSNKKDVMPLNSISIDIVNYRKLIITNNFCEPWGKLFRKELFNQHVFDIPRNIIIAEDLIMNLRLAFNTNKNVSVTHEQTYNYREYAESTFQSFSKTPENEQDIHIQKLLSIPIEQRSEYIKSTIELRVMTFKDFWGYKYQVTDMKNSNFYKCLKADIEIFDYKLSFIEYIVFYATNPIIRFIAITTKKIMNFLRIK